MKKSDLVKIVSTKAHLTKKAASEAIEVTFGEIQRALQKGEKVVLSGFGTFKTTLVKDKLVKFPGTEEKKMVKSHREARFSPGRELKKIVK
jgi:DNA-binding protein HU-beta